MNELKHRPEQQLQFDSLTNTIVEEWLTSVSGQ